MLFEIHAERNSEDKKIFYYDNMSNILKDEAGNYHNYRLSDGTIPYESLNDFIYQGDTGGGDPIPGLGYISFAPTSVLAGATAVATLHLPTTVNTTSIYTISTDGNSTSSVSSVTVPANSLSATFNVTINSTVASTVTKTVVTATLGSVSYSGSLNITPGSGGGGVNVGLNGIAGGGITRRRGRRHQKRRLTKCKCKCKCKCKRCFIRYAISFFVKVT